MNYQVGQDPRPAARKPATPSASKEYHGYTITAYQCDKPYPLAWTWMAQRPNAPTLTPAPGSNYTSQRGALVGAQSAIRTSLGIKRDTNKIGRPAALPKEKKVPLQVSISPENMLQLDAYAAQCGLRIGAAINQLLTEFFAGEADKPGW